MSYGFLDIAVTPSVRAAQAAMGSDKIWADFKGHRAFDRFSAAELGFIAERVKTNLRRLEGALNRVAAFASLHGRAITVPQTEVLLRDLLQQEGQQSVSIDLIQRRVAETYDLRLADMTSKRRPANIALPRMVAMYLSRRLTTASLNERHSPWVPAIPPA